MYVQILLVIYYALLYMVCLKKSDVSKRSLNKYDCGWVWCFVSLMVERKMRESSLLSFLITDRHDCKYKKMCRIKCSVL